MDRVGLDIPLEAGARASSESEPIARVTNQPYAGAADHARSLELGGLTGLDLVEVECVISWGDNRKEQSNRFSTIKAVMAGQEGNEV
jgi:hypothetical protein